MEDITDIDFSVQELYRPVLSDEYAPLDFTKSEFENCEDEDTWKKDWWQEQLLRLTKGYTAPNGVWINPFYYFFLNFCKADILNIDTEENDTANPYYLDYQHEFADLLWFCQYVVTTIKSKKKQDKIIKNAMNIILAKGRRKGLTTVICAYLIYLLLFKNGVKLGYGFPDDDTYRTFRDIFDKMMVELPAMLKPNIVFPDNDSEIGNAYTDEKTGKVKVINRIYWGNFGKSTGAFRGKKLYFAFFDEAGKFGNWSRVKGATKDCFKVGTRKIGYYVFGGTSDAITNKGFRDYKDDFEKPHLSDAVAHFIPSDVGLHPHIDYHTGRSLKEAAKVYLEATRRKLRAEGKLDDLKFEIQENPLIKEECFIPPGGSIYDNHVLNEQIIWIREVQKEKDILIGELEFDKDFNGKISGKVRFVERADGNWQIYRNGFNDYGKEKLFFGAFDDVYKNEAPSSDSMPALMIYKDLDLTEKESDLPVAIYLNRHKNRKKRFEDFLKAAIFWKAKLLGEINDEAMVNYFTVKGHLNYLEKTTNDKFGYAGNAWHGKFKSQSEDLMTQYIEQRRQERCYFIDGINALKDWGVHNTDIGICYHACLLYQYMRRTMASIENINTEVAEPVITLSGIKKPENMPAVLKKFARVR